MQLSFIYRDDISVRGKLDGPLLHMLNELRKEVGISSSAKCMYYDDPLHVCTSRAICLSLLRDLTWLSLKWGIPSDIL